jgi:nitric oxide reductase NorD protein
MSPRGLEHYLTGMRAMCSLNRGEDLILTYVQEMPRRWPRRWGRT